MQTYEPATTEVFLAADEAEGFLAASGETLDVLALATTGDCKGMFSTGSKMFLLEGGPVSPVENRLPPRAPPRACDSISLTRT